jgi:hypothetical protein
VITEIKIQQLKGTTPLNKSETKIFKEFLEFYADRIVQKWIDYFILHKNVDFERITKRLK